MTWHRYTCTIVSSRICFSVVAADSVVDFLYRNHLRPYLFCLGKEEVFRLAPGYTNEKMTTLPWWHPYEVLVHAICKHKHRDDQTWLSLVNEQLSFFFNLVSAHWFLVPLCYIKIWIFLKRQSRKIAGKVCFMKYM